MTNLATLPLSHVQGVGKGTYSVRVAKAFGMDHIAAGDLVRAEMKSGSQLGAEVGSPGGPAARAPRCICPAACRFDDRTHTPSLSHIACSQMKSIVDTGALLPDALILKVMRERIRLSSSRGITSFLLDGFPRTAEQADALEEIGNVQLALNLSLRQEVRLLGVILLDVGWNGRQLELERRAEIELGL